MSDRKVRAKRSGDVVVKDDYDDDGRGVNLGERKRRKEAPPLSLLQLPNEVSQYMFQFLQLKEQYQMKLVCQQFRRKQPGIVFIQIKQRRMEGFSPVGLIMRGKRQALPEQVPLPLLNETTANETVNHMFRTKGQLLDPTVLQPANLEAGRDDLPEVDVSSPDDLHCPSMLFDAQKRRGGNWKDWIYLRLEKEEDAFSFPIDSHNNASRQLRWTLLDLSRSAIRFESGHRLSEPPILRIQGRSRPWQVHKSLQYADLSSLCHLEVVSLRGCSILQRLCLPQSIRAVDLSDCPLLQCLIFLEATKPATAELPQQGVESTDTKGTSGVHRLQALNLRNCRSLVGATMIGDNDDDDTMLFGSCTARLMTHLQELNMNGTKSLPVSRMAKALSDATSLETLSMRYVAHDDHLMALVEASHRRARTTTDTPCPKNNNTNSRTATLRLLDVSFSEKLTDESCRALVQAAGSSLQRLNLRGCRSVSAACYNAIPIELNRNQQWRDQGLGQPPWEQNQQIPTAEKHTARKGDNLFYLAKDNRK